MSIFLGDFPAMFDYRRVSWDLKGFGGSAGSTLDGSFSHATTWGLTKLVVLKCFKHMWTYPFGSNTTMDSLFFQE
jgi:hypothetical protein